MSAAKIKRRYLQLAIPGIAVLAAGLIFLFFISNKKINALETIDDNRFLLDTVVSIRLYESDQRELLEEAFSIIDTYERQLSRHKSDSEVSRINAASAGSPVPVSETTIDLIESGLEYARLSNGMFDPTVGPLVDLWGIGGDNARIPGTDEISEVLALVDYEKVTIDENIGTVTLPDEGMTLDLGGIAKGWIADRTVEFLKENGEDHILINLGGNVLVSGGKPGGDPFKIGMQDPFDDRGRYLGIFSIHEGSVVSSGIYERFFESDGVRYHHILSTTDGSPVRNGLAAVTILSEKSVDGDALSTSAFALGLEEGLKLIGRLDGVDGAFVTLDGKVIMTSGAADRFEVTDPDLVIEIRDL
jgi:thiamine biosynthesis lipoprotein